MHHSNQKSHFFKHWLATSLPIAVALCFVSTNASTIRAQEFIVEDSSVSVHSSASSIEFSPETQSSTGQLIQTKLKQGTHDVFVSDTDQIWLVSARNHSSSACTPPQLEVCLLNKGDWQTASLEDLVHEHSTDVTRQTTVFVHGNRYDLEWCKSRGLQLYDIAFQSGFERPPIRLVLFCWKSERETIRPLHDFKIKTKRSLSLAPTFSSLLHRLKERNVLICSYSLGAQIVVKALEQPCMKGCNHATYKYAMLAPALAPNYSTSYLQSFVDNPLVTSTDVFINREDRVIRASEFVARTCCRKSTSTLEKLTGQCRGHSSNVIKFNDITCEIKASHLLNNYAESPTLQFRIAGMMRQLMASNQPKMGTAVDSLPPEPTSINSISNDEIEFTPSIGHPTDSLPLPSEHTALTPPIDSQSK